jgi:CheY-like chemotaxis protein
LIRLSIVGHLEDAGFAVLEASDAESAIRVPEAHSEVRLVFTDVQMPAPSEGMS